MSYEFLKRNATFFLVGGSIYCYVKCFSTFFEFAAHFVVIKTGQYTKDKEIPETSTILYTIVVFVIHIVGVLGFEYIRTRK
jgi:hypothetical protein